MTALSEPYVGDGADGARRSAQIDLEEADCLPSGPDRDRCLASARESELQAEYLEELCRGRAASRPGDVPRA